MRTTTVVAAILFFGLIAWRSLRLIRSSVEPYRAIASGVLWALVAWAVAGITLDMLLSFVSRYVYVFYAVVIERSWALAKREGEIPAEPMVVSPRRGAPE